MKQFTVYIDGGSKGNGTPNARAYGSSRTMQTTPERKLYNPKRFEFGLGTNNQAEYQILIQTLNNIISALFNGYLCTGDEITLLTDSALVINQVNKQWKVKAKQLRALRLMAWEAIEFLHERGLVIKLRQVSRDSIVEMLGH